VRSKKVCVNLLFLNVLVFEFYICEFALYPPMNHPIAKIQCRIKENSWLARLASLKLRKGQVAIVFGHTVHLRNTTREEFLADTPWVCHELTHVQQYRRYGTFGFVVRYLYSWVRTGFRYPDINMEKEARAAEGNTALLDYFEFM
jgi:hypothetical protein